ARFLLLHPPLPVLARAPYAVLAAAAVSLLPGWARRQLRLPPLPASEAVLVGPARHAMVHAIRWAIPAPAAPPQGPHPRRLPHAPDGAACPPRKRRSPIRRVSGLLKDDGSR